MLAGICTLCKPWEALVIGSVGAIISSGVDLLLWRLKVDDPVGVVSVHGACGIWGLLSVGESSLILLCESYFNQFYLVPIGNYDKSHFIFFIR